MSKALLEALNDFVDAKLVEHGLLEEEEPVTKTKTKASAGKKKAAATDDDDELDHDKLKALAMDAAKVAGKPAVVAVLKKAKAAQISNLKPAQFEKVADALKALADPDGDEDGEDDDLFK